MPRIVTSGLNQAESLWIKENDEKIIQHSAWRGDISESQATNLLEGRNPFVYILRTGQEKYTYFISFVKEDRSIKHQIFTLKYDREGWYYENGVVTGPAEVVSREIDDLIPQMVHCNPDQCKPLPYSRV